MHTQSYATVYVRKRPGFPTQGWLIAGPHRVPVALGRSGILADKREGDGGTPRGRFKPVRLWWRADRGLRPRTRLAVRRMRPQDGWCENPADRRYNRPVILSDGSPGDRLWRQDRLYDLIVELDHNMRPRVAGRGSAVFIHVARTAFKPTAGCVALRARDLRRLIERLGPRTYIDIR